MSLKRDCILKEFFVKVFGAIRAKVTRMGGPNLIREEIWHDTMFVSLYIWHVYIKPVPIPNLNLRGRELGKERERGGGGLLSLRARGVRLRYYR